MSFLAILFIVFVLLILITLFLVALKFLIYLIPVALVIALILWLIYRFYWRKKIFSNLPHSYKFDEFDKQKDESKPKRKKARDASDKDVK